MEDLIKVLKSLHDELKDGRPKGEMLGCGAGYRNGHEDGYKYVTKRIKKYIEEIESTSKSD